VYGPAAIGVILTGSLDDGTAGLWTIKRLGGIAVVQDPAEALYPSMPASAARHVAVDYSLPLSAIAPLLTRLASTPAGNRAPTPEDVEIEVNIARAHSPLEAGVESLGEPSPFACPECSGVLRRMREPTPLRFRCHTGHAYSAQSLIAAMNEAIEESLWSVVRGLQEGGLLLRHMATHLEGADVAAAGELLDQAKQTFRQADTVRSVITTRDRLHGRL